jgi:hypothetical protein
MCVRREQCLAAGSNIIDHEYESEEIRPLAKALVKHLDQLREQLRTQALRNTKEYQEKLRHSLRSFDYLLAEFELKYGLPAGIGSPNARCLFPVTSALWCLSKVCYNTKLNWM